MCVDDRCFVDYSASRASFRSSTVPRPGQSVATHLRQGTLLAFAIDSLTITLHTTVSRPLGRLMPHQTPVPIVCNLRAGLPFSDFLFEPDPTRPSITIPATPRRHIHYRTLARSCPRQPALPRVFRVILQQTWQSEGSVFFRSAFHLGFWHRRQMFVWAAFSHR